MRPIDFNAVKELVSMERVLELIGWRPRWREGQQLRGPCPVHRSKNPHSRGFAVSPAKGWYCHGCRRGGSQIDLYAAVRQLPPLAAAVDLCERCGVAVPYLPRRPRPLRRRGNGEEER